MRSGDHVTGTLPETHHIGEFVRYQLTTDFEGEPVITEGRILNIHFHAHGDGMGTWYTVTGCPYEIPRTCIINKIGENQ